MRKHVAQGLGTALLLLTLAALENLSAHDGSAHAITIWLAELGFLLFFSRTLLALRPVGPWLARAPAWARAALVLALAGLLFASSVSAAAFALGGLLLVGGVLGAEFFVDLAERAQEPARRIRRPALFASLLLAGLVVAGVAHYVFARAAFMTWGDTPLTSGFGAATLGLHASALVVLALLLLAAAGRGRDALARRAAYAVALLYPLTWFIGYATTDALGVRAAGSVPLLAIGVAAIEFFDILFSAPERLAEQGRAIDRAALWDVFLTVAFGLVLVLSLMDAAGATASEAIFGMKAFTWMGLLAGGLLVPLARWRARRRRREAAAAPAQDAEADAAPGA